jgi:hypothetical protein
MCLAVQAGNFLSYSLLSEILSSQILEQTAIGKPARGIVDAST